MEEKEEKPVFQIEKSEVNLILPSFHLSDETEDETKKNYIIENQTVFQEFIDQIESKQGNEVFGPISDIKIFLLHLVEKESHLGIRILEIDTAINILINLLNKFDICTNFCIIDEILQCLDQIWKIYSFFGQSPEIPKLNDFLSQAFKLDGSKDINYSILNFLVHYSRRFIELSKIPRERILALIFQEEDQNYLFEFLPTKENELFKLNPILPLANHYLNDVLKPHSQSIPSIQIIINSAISYISQCEDLIIKIEEEEEEDFEMNEPIHELNTQICDHISLAFSIFSTCVKKLGDSFFELYCNGEFPLHFIDFFNREFTSGSSFLLEKASLHFLLSCAQSKIDFTCFFNEPIIHFFYPQLVKYLNNGTSLSQEASQLIYYMITMNPDTVNYFLAAGIQSTNAFRPERTFNQNLMNVKLVSLIIHNFTGHQYEFGINEMVKYLIDILMPHENDMSYYAFQILIDLFNFLDGNDKDLFETFLNAFNVYNDDNGMMDEYLTNSELDQPTFELVTLFDSMLKKHYTDE